MKSSIDTSFKLTRRDDIGATITEFRMITGMPTMLEVTQTLSGGGQKQKVTFTLPEASIFRYALAEFQNFKRMSENLDQNENDPEDD